MAMGRLNRPGIMVYGGTIRAGKQPSNDASLDIVNAFQSYGEFIYEKISEEERLEIIQHACPGAGACGGMYTANTMATAIEALGTCRIVGLGTVVCRCLVSVNSIAMTEVVRSSHHMDCLHFI